MLQHFKDTNKSAREDFCTQMQLMAEKDGFVDRHVLSDVATFHVTGEVNKHNTRIWGTEDPHAILQHVRDSLKVNERVLRHFEEVCVWAFLFGKNNKFISIAKRCRQTLGLLVASLSFKLMKIFI